LFCLQKKIDGAHLQVLDKTGQTLDLDAFNNRDLAFLSDTFTAQERRNEWLWGRFVLKRLLCERFELEARKLFIGRDVHEKPIIVEPDGLKNSVSLSHKPPYYAAAVADLGLSVGVDVEIPVAGREAAFFGHFISEIEKSAFVHSDTGLEASVYFSLLWSFKEAYLKARSGTNLAQVKDSQFRLVKSAIDGEFGAEALLPLPIPAKTLWGFSGKGFVSALAVCG
jgi:phosphopantetheinyl transferase